VLGISLRFAWGGKHTGSKQSKAGKVMMICEEKTTHGRKTTKKTTYGGDKTITRSNTSRNITQGYAVELPTQGPVETTGKENGGEVAKLELRPAILETSPLIITPTRLPPFGSSLHASTPFRKPGLRNNARLFTYVCTNSQ